MKKYFVFLVIAVMMTACSKDATEEMLGGGSDNGKAANSVLQVTTRSGGEATISYPVQVYVFQGERLRVGEQSSGIECKAVQTIGDAGPSAIVRSVPAARGLLISAPPPACGQW